MAKGVRKEPGPTHSLVVELGVPADLRRLRYPRALNRRLHELLDRQDSGEPLTAWERQEAEALVDLAETLSLLQMRAVRTGSRRGS